MSADEPSELEGLRRRLGLTFRLVSDGDVALSARYGVRQADRDLALPSTFVVDAEGTIRFVRVGSHPVDRPTVKDVLEALAH